MKNKIYLIFGAVLIVSILLTAVITYAVTQLSFDPAKKYRTELPKEIGNELYINKVEMKDTTSEPVPTQKLNMCMTDIEGITTCCAWDGEKCIDEPKETDLNKIKSGLK